jgi:hypothetical protein
MEKSTHDIPSGKQFSFEHHHAIYSWVNTNCFYGNGFKFAKVVEAYYAISPIESYEIIP